MLIDQTVESQKRDIVSLKETIEQKLPALREATSKLNEVKRELESRSENIITEIEILIPRLIKAIKEKETQMYRELSDIVRDKRMILDKQLQQLNNELKRVENIHTFTGNFHSSLIINFWLRLA